MDPWEPSNRTLRPPRPWLLHILIATIVVMSALLLWRILDAGPGGVLDENAEPRTVTPRGELAAGEKTTIEIFKAAAPAVVHITNIQLRERIYSLNPTEMAKGMGTGFIWDENGYVVTNWHVVEGGQKWKVTLSDNTEYDARAVGGSPDKDLAVLKIDAPKNKLRPILLGTSGDLQVGQSVYAIGNPFGLDQTLTTGVISGLDREIQSGTGVPIRGVIQTDAAINPGNSGGPLLDSAGRLIGVNTAIASPSGTYAGIGFAVPVDAVNRQVPHIIRKGSVRAGLGIDFWADTYGRRWGKAGAIVKSVKAGSAADRAGLEPSIARGGRIWFGDIIVGVDGQGVRSKSELLRALANREVGEQVRLTVRRQRTDREVKIPLEALAP